MNNDVCRFGHPIMDDNYCKEGHIRPVKKPESRPLNKRDFPLGGDDDLDEIQTTDQK